MNLKPRTRFHAAGLAAVLGLGLIAGPGPFSTRADATPTSAAVAAEPAKDALAYWKSVPAMWNEQRWEEFEDFYATDALVAPPNHDLIRGNKAIVAFYKTVRPLFGAMSEGLAPHSVITSGNLVTIMGAYEFGPVRITSTEVFERQPDGRYRSKQETFGFRDPLM